MKIAECGIIEAILKAMTALLDNDEVQECDCCALVTLSLNDNNKVKIAECGGIVAILKAMAACFALGFKEG